MRPVILTILFCAVAFAVYLAIKPNQVSASYQQETGQQGQVRAPSTDNEGGTTKQDAAKDETPHWYASPEWILAIVGSFTFLVIGWQSYETMRSADAAKKAAKAARLNAQAIINSERAWIDGEIIHKKQLNIHAYSLHISNHGKTPAKLLSYEIRWGYEIEDQLPSPESLSSNGPEILNRLFGTSGSSQIGDWFRIDHMFSQLPEPSEMSTKILWINILYEDIVGGGEVHKTTFVFRCRPLLDILERRSAYDEYT